MTVKDLKIFLEKYDDSKEIVIRFALSNKDDIGYVLIPNVVGEYYENVAIYGDYIHTKEDCEFIGQIDIKELWEKEMNNSTD